MKVLQINSFFTVGGPPRIMNGIYDTLIENRFDCKIAAARKNMYVPEDSYRICSDTEVKVNAIKARLFDNEGFNATKSTQKLVEYIKEFDPDIIHLHNLHGYCINLEILFAFLKEANKPVVWTLHDCWAFTGHCAHFSLIGCEKWKTECFSCPQTKKYPSAIFTDGSKNNYENKKKTLCGVKNMTIVTPSKWLASFIPNSILKEYQTHVINNGIDLNTFSNLESDILERNGLSGKKIILGVAQNWAEKKGLEDFVELSTLLNDSYKVVIIGLTDKQKRNLPASVYGITKTDNVEELVKWYSAAMVFVNLTYQDNFPTVNIESLACGTPVITYKTGGSPEAIDEYSGWIVEQGNIDEVARIINKMDAKQSYTQACINRAKYFDRADKYLDYIKLYETMFSLE